jgi:hypothetical protein
MVSLEISQVLGVEAVSLPEMAFQVPEGIHAVEISLDPRERAAAVERLVRDIYPGGDELLWQAVGAVYGMTVEGMTAEGISFYGVGLYAIDDGVAHCSLNVAVIESGHPSPEIAVRGIGEILRHEHLRDVWWLDLPCGPAVSSMSFRNVVVDGQYTKTGDDQELTFGQMQIYIPFPTVPYTVVFTMDTASLEQWEEFSVGMANIVGSVEFGDSPELVDQSANWKFED